MGQHDAMTPPAPANAAAPAEGAAPSYAAQVPLLDVRDLRTVFTAGRGARTIAVDGVSFAVARGRTFGIVGESGSGKSTLARSILRLIAPTSGTVRFGGVDVLACGPRELRRLRRRMQMIFQDPFGSLNPKLMLDTLIGEALHVHGIVRTAAERRERVAAVLRRVGLRPDDMRRFPHEFSGGQRQRIGIARALVLDPELIVCDEPVSALDVSIQSQILNLLGELQEQSGIAYVFIAHGLPVVRHFCDEVAVMRAGRFVECGPTEQIFTAPRHEYTKTLLAAAPRMPAVVAD